MKNSLVERQIKEWNASVNGYLNDKVNEKQMKEFKMSIDQYLDGKTRDSKALTNPERFSMPIKSHKLKVNENGEVIHVDKEPKQTSGYMSFYQKKVEPQMMIWDKSAKKFIREQNEDQ